MHTIWGKLGSKAKENISFYLARPTKEEHENGEKQPFSRFSVLAT